MSKKFSELRNKMSSKAQIRSRELFHELLEGVESMLEYQLEQRLIESITNAGITSESDYRAALRVVEKVMRASSDAALQENDHWDGSRLLGILVPFIEEYEREHYPMPGGLDKT